jgi:4-amino-4-deoxy-L-arabinose transferase-like glycosyltransferase
MHYNGEPSWLKPPLYFWVEAVFFKMFGLTEYWARFPSALSGYATLILVYLIGVRLYGRKVGFLSMVILASSFFFLKFSRRAMLDVPVAFITILGIYALLRGEKE